MKNRGDKAQTRRGQGVLRTVFKKWDALLLAVVLVAAALSVWFAFRGGGEEIRVYVEGELRYTFSLAEDGEYGILDGKMVIRISDGKAYVESSDCSEQLCVQSSPVSSEGGMIVCLPNRVVIEVGGGEVDAVT